MFPLCACAEPLSVIMIIASSCHKRRSVLDVFVSVQPSVELGCRQHCQMCGNGSIALNVNQEAANTVTWTLNFRQILRMTEHKHTRSPSELKDRHAASSVAASCSVCEFIQQFEMFLLSGVNVSEARLISLS